MRISIAVVTFVAACGPVQAGQPGQPDGPSSDGPGRGDAPGPGSDSGTGSGSDPLADYRSGTRIKMQVLTTPDGAKQFSGWFDTQRNEPCSFLLAADGVTRCMPSRIVLFNVFADSACTSPAALTSAEVAACTRYGIDSETFPSCPTANVFARYGRIFPSATAPGQTQVFQKGASSCTALAVAAGAAVVIPSGPEIPPSNFQAATLTVE